MNACQCDKRVIVCVAHTNGTTNQHTVRKSGEKEEQATDLTVIDNRKNRGT